MAEGQTNAPTPGATRNRVPEMIQRMKASKATGKFTYHAGRGDAVMNLVIGGIALVCLAGIGQTGYQLATGKGRKE